MDRNEERVENMEGGGVEIGEGLKGMEGRELGGKDGKGSGKEFPGSS